MNILLTNDDGIYAAGLVQLAQRLCGEHNVYVAAPDGEYSGAGHSITFFNALTFCKAEYPCQVEAYSIKGTPVDCVKFGLDILFADKKIDIVISGINNVPNIGTDVFYSGTVNAAIEATICGKKGIAVSTLCKNGDYSFPVEFVANNLEKLAKFASGSVTINVNIPCSRREECKGVAIAELGLRRYSDAYKLISNPGEPALFVLTGSPVSEVDSVETHDVALSDKGYITVTPLTLYTTDFKALDIMQKEEFKF
jgi:5'-nucleotidase